MRRFSVVQISISTFLAVIASGCSSSGENPHEKMLDGASSDATFVVEQITGSAESATTDANFSSISTSRLINFTACVRDVAVLESIIGRPFEIRDNSRIIARHPQTDSKGCIYWSENLPVQSLAPEAYLETKRTIVALQDHKGSVTIPLALNPWKTGREAVLDLRYQSAPKTRLEGSQNLTQSEAGLFLSGMRGEITITQGGELKSILQLHFQPKLRRRAMDGSTVLETITEGKFRIKHQLIAHENGTVLPLYAPKEFEARFSNGIMRAKDDITIERKSQKESLLELQMEITPIDAPAGLFPITGSILMGRLTGLVVNSTTDFQETKWESTLPTALSQNNINEKIQTGFVVGQAQGIRISVERLSNEGRPNKVKISVQACMKNSISGEPIVEQRFSVESLGVVRSATSDPERGCIIWEEAVSFNYFAKERYLTRPVRVTAENGFYQGVSAEITLHLNPWEYTQARNAVLDGRYEKPVDGPRADMAEGAEMIFNGAAYNSAGRLFNVDALLNLSVVRKFRFEVRPMIRRMTLQGWQDESLGNGNYKMYVLVQSLDDNSTLAALEMPVEATSGAINTEILLRFDDLRPTLQRNRLLVEIHPEHPIPGLMLGAYEGMFEATTNGGWIRTMKANRSIVKEVQAFKEKPELKSVDSPKLFAQSFDLFVPTEKQAKLYDLGPYQLRSLIKDPNNTLILVKFCPLFFPDGRNLTLCRNNPAAYIEAKSTEHVVKLLAEPRHLKSDLMGFAVSSGFSFGKGRAEDTTDGSTWKKLDVSGSGSLGMGGKFGGVNIGVSMGRSWYRTWSTTERTSNDKRVDGSMDKKLDVEELLFEIDVETKECMTFIPNQKMSPRVKNMFFCNNRPERKTVRETYFYAYQNYFPGIALDSAAKASERKWMILIRGEKRFHGFVELVRDKAITVNFVEGSPLPGKLLNGSMDRYDGYFPGLLSQ